MAKRLTLDKLSEKEIIKDNISRLNFFKRLFLHPYMFWHTVLCFFCKKFKIIKLSQTYTFWGRRMYVIFPEVVSSDIFRFGFIEPNVARSIIKCISKGDVAIDIGAHFGFFTLLMADMVGPKGQVHSFEPIPSTFKILSKNVAELSNTKINRKAIWRLNETLYLNDYGLNASAFNSYREPRGYDIENNKSNKVKAEAIKLDEYVKNNNIIPKFIKIDAESTEYEVLLGMNYILKNIKPIICLEIGDLGVVGARKSKDVIKYILDYGYEVFEFKSNKLKSHKIKENYNYGNLIFKHPQKI